MPTSQHRYNLRRWVMLLIATLAIAGCPKKKSPPNIQGCVEQNGEITHGGCSCLDKIFDPQKVTCTKSKQFTTPCKVSLAMYEPNGNCRKKYDTFEGIVPESGTCSDERICVPLSPRRTISKIASEKCFKPIKDKKVVDGKCLEISAELIRH